MSHTEQYPSGEFSPRKWMKSWHPEQFSDSIEAHKSQLTRALLEFHLDTLTSRNQDTEFEHFALEIARRTICPNLKSQTGPTGGGDAKVDTETLPVDPSLALVWRVGNPAIDAAVERWAFAFSAMKDWQPKLRSDVSKIAQTGRGYTKAFFVTNQSVSDKKSSALEDELRQKHHIDVRILSRTWLLDSVFSGQLEQLAIATLRIEVPGTLSRIQGPHDVAKSQRISDLEHTLQASVIAGQVSLESVNVAIEIARLARELEKPRIEIDGYYDRAARLAASNGTPHQQLIVAYQKAWTTYNWHEDFEHFNGLYDDVESLAKISQNSWHLELLSNLWCLAFTQSRLKESPVGVETIMARTITLSEALQKLTENEDRPNSALHARSLLLLQRLISTQPHVPSTVFVEFQEVLSSCKGLIGFPLKPLSQLIRYFESDDQEYERLFEKLIEVTSENTGELDAAQLILERGARKLEAGNYYSAIALIGRAASGLAHHESRQTLMSALNLLGHAYEQVGLFWAARGTLLNSLMIAFQEFNSYADTDRLKQGPLDRMRWLELQLGRIPNSFEWSLLKMIVDERISIRATAPDIDTDIAVEEVMAYDCAVAVLLLRAKPQQLRKCLQLPDALGTLGLDLSKSALLWTLGQDDLGFYKNLARPGESRREVYQKLMDQPIASQIADHLVMEDEQSKCVLTSSIWGCCIEVATSLDSPLLEFAESTLAAIEATLATLGRHKCIAFVSAVRINIKSADIELVRYSFDQVGARLHCSADCGNFSIRGLSSEVQFRLRDTIRDFVLELLARVFHFENLETLLNEIVRGERALERGLMLTTSFVTLANVLGDTRRLKLGDWISQQDQVYPLVEPFLNQGLRNTSAAESSSSEQPSTLENFHQKRLVSQPLLYLPDWDAAGWSGAGYVWGKDSRTIPTMFLLFKNGSVAKKILVEWNQLFGEHDAEDMIRIAITRGVQRSNPFAYRLGLSSDFEALNRIHPGKAQINVCRGKLIEPTDDTNLSNFLRSFSIAKKFQITGVELSSDGKRITPINVPPILKRKLFVHQAWEIGVGSPDSVLFQPEDDPIIPEACSDAPVIELLRELRDQRHNK